MAFEWIRWAYYTLSLHLALLPQLHGLWGDFHHNGEGPEEFRSSSQLGCLSLALPSKPLRGSSISSQALRHVDLR